MRKIETLTFSENRESLPDFQIKIRDLDEYLTASIVMKQELKELGFCQNNGTYWYVIDKESDFEIEIDDIDVCVWKYGKCILLFEYDLDKVKQLIDMLK